MVPGSVAQAAAGVPQPGATWTNDASPRSGEPPALPGTVLIPPAAPQPAQPAGPAAAPVPRYSGAIVTHVARARDTTSKLLRRIWGQDDAAVETLFRSLNPAIDGQGPWPAGTIVIVPQRTRHRRDSSGAQTHVETARATLPAALPPRRDTARDNPAGQVQSSAPYFCGSTQPQNGAEDAYIRQACARQE